MKPQEGSSFVYWNTARLLMNQDEVVVFDALLSVVQLSVQKHSALCTSPLALFVKTLTTSLCSALLLFFFFLLLFSFLRLPRARSVIPLPPCLFCPFVCLSLAALWQLLKGCLSWGTDPRTKTRPRPSTGAPCVRPPLAATLVFFPLRLLSLSLLC